MLTVEDQKLFEQYMNESKQTTKSSIRKLYDYLTGLEKEIPKTDWGAIYKENIDDILGEIGISTQRRYNADISKFIKIVGEDMKIIKEDNNNNEELIKRNAVSIANRLNKKHECRKKECTCNKEINKTTITDNKVKTEFEELITTYNKLNKEIGHLKQDILQKQEKIVKLSHDIEVNDCKQASLMRQAFENNLISWN